MGGEIVLRCPKEGGSIFTLKLYHVEIASFNHKPRPKETVSKHFSKEPVLAIDDIEDNLVLLQNLLQDYGLEVFTCNDPVQGIAYAKKEQPKLIFMDIKMPNMDGYEATAILKQDPLTAHIPIIAVSASVVGEKEEAMQKGLFDAFVSKPINTKELEDAIARYIAYTSLEKTPESSLSMDFRLFIIPETKKVFIETLEAVLDQGNLSAIGDILQTMFHQQMLTPATLQKLQEAHQALDLFELEKMLRLIIDQARKEP